MPNIKHPTIPGVTRTVSHSDLRDWLAQGWVRTDPLPVRPTRPPESPAESELKPRPVKRSPRPRKPKTPHAKS